MTLEFRCTMEVYSHGVRAEASKMWTRNCNSSPRVNRNSPMVIAGHSQNEVLGAGYAGFRHSKSSILTNIRQAIYGKSGHNMQSSRERARG